MRHWTSQGIEYLQENWGKISISAIAKKLDRTEKAIEIKAQKLGLGSFLLASDYISLKSLCDAIGKKYGTGVVNTFKTKGLKTKVKKLRKKTVLVTTIEDFWDFAEKNKGYINISQIPPLALGAEPYWVESARKKKTVCFYKPQKWTETEISKLKYYISNNYDYQSISNKLNRSVLAVQNKISQLGLKLWPRKAAITKWSESEYNQAINLYNEGYDYETIGKMMKRSTLSVRGKIKYETKKIENY